jgi:hypothetical protein
LRTGFDFLVNFRDQEAIRYSDAQSRAAIPTEIETIGRNCCSDLLFLKQVTFASASCMSLIEASALANFSTLQSIVLPASVEILENGCFDQCMCLELFTFPPDSKVREIVARAFRQCSSLTELTIPASVDDIDYDCFDECRLLFPLNFAPPSRLRNLTLPRLSHVCQPIPDGVDRLAFFMNLYKFIAYVLTFGRKSKLQEIWPDYAETTPGRTFLRLSSPSLKGMRLGLEFDE